MNAGQQVSLEIGTGTGRGKTVDLSPAGSSTGPRGPLRSAVEHPVNAPYLPAIPTGIEPTPGRAGRTGPGSMRRTGRGAFTMGSPEVEM